MYTLVRIFTYILFSFIVLTTTAADDIVRRSCRVGKILPQAAHRSVRVQTDKNKYIGERRQLVVMAAFKDKAFAEDEAEALQKWDKFFNAVNYTEGSFTGSIHDYFYAQSYSQFDLTFDLVYVQLPDSCKKYRSTEESDEFSQFMVDDIVDDLMTRDIDWSPYDWDGDDYVDQLLIIYAGKGMSAGGGANSIWPHQWWLSKHLDLTNPNNNTYRSYRTVSSGGKDYIIDKYCCIQEIVQTASTRSSFGTICHEYSHCFGLPNFYYESVSVLNNWDVMDLGNYGNMGFCPCGYSAHERMFMGWLTPVELSSTTAITDMPALSNQPVAYIIRNDAHPDEYYMIENRQQYGWDATLPGGGIIIFHVDYSKDVWTGIIEMPNAPNKKRYYIFPADNRNNGSFSSSYWSYPYKKTTNEGLVVLNDQLTNESAPASILNNPNLDGSYLMSKPITQMQVNAEGLASFVFMESESAIILTQKDDNSNSPVYDLQGRQVYGSLKPGLYVRNGKKMVQR